MTSRKDGISERDCTLSDVRRLEVLVRSSAYAGAASRVLGPQMDELRKALTGAGKEVSLPKDLGGPS
eukprot:gene24618-12807_t